MLSHFGTIQITHNIIQVLKQILTFLLIHFSLVQNICKYFLRHSVFPLAQCYNANFTKMLPGSYLFLQLVHYFAFQNQSDEINSCGFSVPINTLIATIRSTHQITLYQEHYTLYRGGVIYKCRLAKPCPNKECCGSSLSCLFFTILSLWVHRLCRSAHAGPSASSPFGGLMFLFDMRPESLPFTKNERGIFEHLNVF